MAALARFVSGQCMFGYRCFLDVLPTLCSLILSILLSRGYYYPHFIEEKTKDQRE